MLRLILPVGVICCHFNNYEVSGTCKRDIFLPLNQEVRSFVLIVWSCLWELLDSSYISDKLITTCFSILLNCCPNVTKNLLTFCSDQFSLQEWPISNTLKGNVIRCATDYDTYISRFITSITCHNDQVSIRLGEPYFLVNPSSSFVVHLGLTLSWHTWAKVMWTFK